MIEINNSPGSGSTPKKKTVWKKQPTGVNALYDTGTVAYQTENNCKAKPRKPNSEIKQLRYS